MKDQCYQFIKGPNNKISIVGFGSYGEVKLAKNTETGEIVAIKMINGRNAKDEIDVHHKLNHPNIIRLLNYYYEKDKNTTYMVLEFAEGGSLNDKIKFGYGQLPKENVKKYFRDVCKAVNYLHSLKYMHRDIKPENILLTKDGHAKLCDFGFAAILEYRSTLCGTYEYMAPEMIQEKPYDYKVDVWALGILLFELIQGTAPFRGENGQDVITEMKKSIVFSSRFEKDEIDLIKKILRVNADNRPNVSAILEHPFFKDIEDTPLLQDPAVYTTHTSRQGSNWSQSGELQKMSEKSSKTEKTLIDKEFKYYVPQGAKTNSTAVKGQSYVPVSPIHSPQYQGFNNNSNLTSNQSSSVSSSFRGNQAPSQSYTQNKVTSPTMKNLPQMSTMTSMTSPSNQGRVAGQNFQGSTPSSYVPGAWRKL